MTSVRCSLFVSSRMLRIFRNILDSSVISASLWFHRRRCLGAWCRRFEALRPPSSRGLPDLPVQPVLAVVRGGAALTPVITLRISVRRVVIPHAVAVVAAVAPVPVVPPVSIGTSLTSCGTWGAAVRTASSLTPRRRTGVSVCIPWTSVTPVVLGRWTPVVKTSVSAVRRRHSAYRRGSGVQWHHAHVREHGRIHASHSWQKSWHKSWHRHPHGHRGHVHGRHPHAGHPREPREGWQG